VFPRGVGERCIPRPIANPLPQVRYPSSCCPRVGLVRRIVEAKVGRTSKPPLPVCEACCRFLMFRRRDSEPNCLSASHADSVQLWLPTHAQVWPAQGG